jgi:hypothetical protein
MGSFPHEIMSFKQFVNLYLELLTDNKIFSEFMSARKFFRKIYVCF